MIEFKALINGEFVKTTKKLEIISPVNNNVAGVVSSLVKEDIDKAYKVAKIAQEEWANKKLVDRIKYINSFKELIVKNKQRIAELIMIEIAKSKKDALGEVERTVELIEFTIEEVKRIYPIAKDGKAFGIENKIGIFEREPLGVICAISPFNYPFNLALAKIIPALLVGNAVVFKPATQGSLVGCFLGELSVLAKFPKGIFNVVTGRGRDIGDEIVSHEEIDMISFTGSVAVGKHIQAIAKTANIVLELGGKDPAVVLDDKDLEHYASEIVAGAFGYSGQRCTAIKRVITTNEIADKLVPILVDKVNKLTVGNPEKNCNITPLIDTKTKDYVLGLITEAKEKGAKALNGDRSKGNLVWPTLVDYVTTEMKLAWEEPFGPVLPIIRIDKISEIVKVVNESNFGLQASLFTQNINDAFIIAKKLKVGTVNINGKSQRGPDNFPFLGIKDSGVGVQGIEESILSMTRYKGIVINYRGE
ncbi:NADP-dependent glyceraldehyde-3-phosphate dehydrogenase [Spiroplasma endosymbiont of Crioceris asparagi]|uniref:NADP-dependent glyceraldehyde-3-phosphate dehydrogenase n=1 Tax=Spiroplasma endosymbiont of Crioceris asparagi TaxID=3066286 RepID=UPI0030CAB5CE